MKREELKRARRKSNLLLVCILLLQQTYKRNCSGQR